MNLKDKVVVITGAGSGIGAATAKLFGRHKASVVVSDINLANAETVVKAIRNEGGTAWAIATDVTQFKQVEGLIKAVVEKHGNLDVMINNAGIGGKKQVKTAEHTLDDWHNVIAVNQTGVFYCMKFALEQMQKQKYGNLVNVASLAGLKASGNNLSYAASKFAVVGMTKSAALEYGRKNIRINAVCPGFTHSALLDQLLSTSPDMGEKLKRIIPMGRFGKAEEIAEAICWLASENSKFMTGQTITLDGGTSL